MPKGIRTGYSKHYLFQTWYNIKYRCSGKKKKDRKHYFLQNIRFYPEWDNSFIAFKTYIENTIGERPKEHSIDRIDSSKGYFPGNLRWATKQQQAVNQRKYYNVETKSKHKGVYSEHKKKLWRAILIHKRQRIGLGRFKLEIDAAHAWNKAVLKYRGPGHFLNKI